MINYTSKLYILLGMLLLSCSSMHGMIIKEPYKPSFGARHPVLTRIAQAGSIGIGMYLVACYAQHLAPELFESASALQAGVTGIAGFLGTYWYQARKAPHVVDAVLCDPLTVLKCIQRVRNEFYSAVKHNNLDTINNITKLREEYRVLAKQFEQQCPFFLLGECIKQGSGPCILSREFQPKYREQFEHHVTQALLEKLSTGPVSYTSFACGDAFQDLVIIAKTLAQKPDACIHIDLIDIKHIPFVTVCDFLATTRQIREDTALDLADARDQMLHHARTHLKAGDFNDGLIEKRIPEECMVIEKTYQQFITWLQKTFPQAKLTLTIHDKVQSTLEYLEQNARPYPDVISAADIQDDMSLLSNSTGDYGTLCRVTLQQQPHARTIWLAKGLTGGVALATASLVRKHQTDKETQIQNADGSKTTIYCQVTAL